MFNDECICSHIHTHFQCSFLYDTVDKCAVPKFLMIKLCYINRNKGVTVVEMKVNIILQFICSLFSLFMEEWTYSLLKNLTSISRFWILTAILLEFEVFWDVAGVVG